MTLTAPISVLPAPAACYKALAARDARFDGLFFVGVTSTGIYCRPICPARTPNADNCRFFASAMTAEKAGFRPCLRCRPELAPGSAPVDDAQRIAGLIVQRLEEGTVGGEAGLEEIAAQFELSARQIRRIVQSQLGVSPIELIQTRRLLLAKQLLTDTALPVTDIAFASGFASLRRFNAAFRARYLMPPSRLRKAAADNAPAADNDSSTLRLGYRPPYDWDCMLGFLAGRCLQGVEHVADGAYFRTVAIGARRGWIRVSHAPRGHVLRLRFSHGLLPVLPVLLARLRNLFDLSARPDQIARQLAQDARLKPLVARSPGLRLPGAFDGFELALRAVLGQQVSVKAATTLGGRLAAAYGSPLTTPFVELTRLAPTPERLIAAGADAIAKHGIVGARARSIVALACAVADVSDGKGLRLEAGADPQLTAARLTALPGIGPWTAQYVVMRALRWPDAFPKEDVALLKALGGVSPAQAEKLSQAWRPWRSYAVMHLWRRAAEASAAPRGRTASGQKPGAQRKIVKTA